MLDWSPRKDPRSLQYPARTQFRRTEPINITWRTPTTVLDQGREGACVGFGWAHEALTTPVRVDFARVAACPVSDPTKAAQYIYHEAQKIDEWAGESYEGTSVLAGAKICQRLGIIREYRWCFSVRDIALSLANIGPVVIGINWYEGMYWPIKGVVSVSGELAGGHCILVVGYRKAGVIFPDEAAFILFNSWGPDWGLNGLAFIRESELAKLMSEQGEACVPVHRSYGR